MSGLHSKCRGGGVSLAYPRTSHIFILFVTIAETLGHTTGNQTPRTYMKPHSEPAPARARVVDLSCRIDWGVAFRFREYIQSPPNQPTE